MSCERTEAYTKQVYKTEEGISSHIRWIEQSRKRPPNFSELAEEFMDNRNVIRGVFNAAFQKALREERLRFVLSGGRRDVPKGAGGIPPFSGDGNKWEEKLLHHIYWAIENNHARAFGRPPSFRDLEIFLKIEKCKFSDDGDFESCPNPLETVYDFVRSDRVRFVLARGERDMPPKRR